MHPLAALRDAGLWGFFENAVVFALDSYICFTVPILDARDFNGSVQFVHFGVDIGKNINVKFRLVDYDFESFAKEIENSRMPKNNFAHVIRTGYWKF